MQNIRGMQFTQYLKTPGGTDFEQEQNIFVVKVWFSIFYMNWKNMIKTTNTILFTIIPLFWAFGHKNDNIWNWRVVDGPIYFIETI